ncbi:MAG TPA: hypothetical protein VFA89_10945 [Terriglobales bacterium]|nr:hypothetical protein [Terriglobales bacterium]
MRLWISTIMFLVSFNSESVLAQTQPPSDPQALSFAAQSIAALTGGNAVSDVTLTGDVSYVAGSDVENGTFTLRAKGYAEGRVDLALSGGSYTDIQNNVGSQQGEHIATDGTITRWAWHNCWTDPAWFFPVLSSLSVPTNPNAVFAYVGTEMRNGVSVQHLTAYFYVTGANSDVISLAQKASSTDFYLDAAALLPVAVVTKAHPDDDALTSIPVEIDFSNYQSISGIQVPLRIQKYLNGSLLLDLTVAGVSPNTGLSDVLFAIQ